MSDDTRDGIATTVVVAEHLRKKAPDGRYWVENAVTVFDAMIVEHIEDLGFGQNLRKGKPRVTGETRADCLQVFH